jgi:selenide,water dikinase
MMGGPVVKDVVLVGAGHAHVQVLRRFGMRPIEGVRFTLITRELHTPYSGMLPGLVAGRYGFDEAHIDTGPLARFAGARLYADEIVGLDLAERRVLCRDRPPVPYDLLSINIGSRPNTGDVPGAAAHAIPVKPIDGFLARFEALKARVLAGRSRHVLLVGGGAGGVELLLSVERRLRRELDAAGGDGAALRFTLVTGADGLLPRFPRPFRERFKAVMAARGIALSEGARVAAVEAGAVVLGDGARLCADEILWTTEAAPARWLAETGLALDDRGFLRVDAKLRAFGRDDVFAAGDTIAFDPAPIPRSGVYSVRAGPVLADNIRAALTGRRLRPYRPQRDALYIVATGEPHAIATRNGLTVEGAWVWRWKDWIDRRFMRRFNELPEMMQSSAEPASPLADKQALRDISAIAMRCGGCGAKVGATVLTRALGGLAPAPNPDVLVGLDAPDDAAVVDIGGRQVSVHTVDYFRAIVDDPFRFGMIAANHALGDLYAMGAEPHTALAIATVPYGLEAKVEADLAAMMAGANAVLREAGCALVGGHTSEGAELALGFALNGLAARERVLRKEGLRPGDALILTKPIGTGTLLAGQMRGRARARWVEAALAQMCVPNRRAGAILAAHGASAMTDVTGFGLLGHLVEMTRASEVDVHLVLERIPVLEGARETVARGVFSSLQPQNLRLRRAVRDLAAAQALPLYPLLFDPQTAGGLLAGVPAERAPACLAALHDAGYAQAAVIGRVAPRSDTLEPITLGARGDPLDDVAVPEAADARSVAEPARSV